MKNSSTAFSRAWHYGRVFPTLLLALVAALTLALGAGAEEMAVALSGAPFVWERIVGPESSPNAAVRSTLVAVLQEDLQAAAGALATVTVDALLVNTTALYVEYTAALAGGATAAAVAAAVMGSPLDKLNEAVAALPVGLPTAVGATEPMRVVPAVPLLPRPRGPATAAPSMAERWEAATLAGTFGSTQVVALEGFPAGGWGAADAAAVGEALFEDVAARAAELRPYLLLRRTAASVGEAGGRGRVTLGVEQGVPEPTANTTYNMFDALELASIVTDSTPTALNAALGTTGVTIYTAVDERAIGAGGYCRDGACIAPIVTGAIVAAATLVLFVVVLVLVCCGACGMAATGEDAEGQEQQAAYKNASPHTEGEADAFQAEPTFVATDEGGDLDTAPKA